MDCSRTYWLYYMSSTKVVITFACLYSHTIHLWINSLVLEWPTFIDVYSFYLLLQRDVQGHPAIFILFPCQSPRLVFMRAANVHLRPLAHTLDYMWKPWCGVTQLVARRLAVRQARVRFSARHHRSFPLSRQAMKKWREASANDGG